MSCVFPPDLVSLVLSMFLAKHVTGKFRPLILVSLLDGGSLSSQQLSTCWKICHWCPSLHLILCLLGDMFCTGKGFPPESVRQWQGWWAPTTKVYEQCWREWAGWCARVGALCYATSAPKLADLFLVHLCRVGLAWYRAGIYHSAHSAFS